MSDYLKMRLASLTTAIVARFTSYPTQWEENHLNSLAGIIDEAVELGKVNPTPNRIDWRDLSDLLKEMAAGQKKIECIKLYRQLTGVGLKEAKDEVEKYFTGVPRDLTQA